MRSHIGVPIASLLSAPSIWEPITTATAVRGSMPTAVPTTYDSNPTPEVDRTRFVSAKGLLGGMRSSVTIASERAVPCRTSASRTIASFGCRRISASIRPAETRRATSQPTSDAPTKPARAAGTPMVTPNA